jgi:hypothetical protein
MHHLRSAGKLHEYAKLLDIELLKTRRIFSILLHVRFPWQHDIGVLSRNNGIVQHCCVSLVMQQYWMALASLVDNNVNKQHCYTRNNRQAFPWLQDGCLRTSTDIGSVVLRSRESRRACVLGDRLLLV